jgi:hypothetical protein
MFKKKAILIFLIIMNFMMAFYPGTSFSQNVKDSTKTESIAVKTDTSVVQPFTMTKSPLLAFGLSIIPGAGQIYVGSYWKAPLLLGGACALAYSVYYFNRNYQDTYNKYEEINSKHDPANNNTLDSIRLYREFYRDNRDMSAFYLLGVYIIAAVDAYVGAHLYDFNVSDNFTFMLAPDPRFGVRANFYLKW